MISIKGICYIIGACNDSHELSFKPEKSDIVIAADGGYDLLKKSNIEVDILLGDFDSIESVPTHKNIIRHPVEKDDTDSFLAYKTGMEKDYRTFVVFGGIGGRMDHTIANVQMLSHMAKSGARGFLVSENTIITAIHNSKLSLPSTNTGKIGVFAHSGTARGVDISGLKYTLDNGEISPDFQLGLSNEFIGENARISVTDGTLIIVWYESIVEFLNKIERYMEV